jgi:hypothetical protein
MLKTINICLGGDSSSSFLLSKAVKQQVFATPLSIPNLQLFPAVHEGSPLVVRVSPNVNQIKLMLESKNNILALPALDPDMVSIEEYANYIVGNIETAIIFLYPQFKGE